MLMGLNLHTLARHKKRQGQKRTSVSLFFTVVLFLILLILKEQLKNYSRSSRRALKQNFEHKNNVDYFI